MSSKNGFIYAGLLLAGTAPRMLAQYGGDASAATPAPDQDQGTAQTRSAPAPSPQQTLPACVLDTGEPNAPQAIVAQKKFTFGGFQVEKNDVVLPLLTGDIVLLHKNNLSVLGGNGTALDGDQKSYLGNLAQDARNECRQQRFDADMAFLATAYPVYPFGFFGVDLYAIGPRITEEKWHHHSWDGWCRENGRPPHHWEPLTANRGNAGHDREVTHIEAPKGGHPVIAFPHAQGGGVGTLGAVGGGHTHVEFPHLNSPATGLQQSGNTRPSSPTSGNRPQPRTGWQQKAPANPAPSPRANRPSAPVARSNPRHGK